MKKFSKLIQESKSEELWTKHPLVNPVDWDEIFKPLIEHIHSNLKSKVPYPGEGIFSSKTKGALDDLIDSITDDYSEYFQNVVDDGSQESFLNAWSINCDYKDIIDCIQPLLDNSDEVLDNPNWDGGYIIIEAMLLRYKSLEELIEDIEDVHLKLKMLKTNYKLVINTKNWSNLNIKDSDTNITKKIEDFSTAWLPIRQRQSSYDLSKFINGITIFIYNKETVQVGDLD